jgi:hypothetical protein
VSLFEWLVLAGILAALTLLFMILRALNKLAAILVVFRSNHWQANRGAIVAANLDDARQRREEREYAAEQEREAK